MKLSGSKFLKNTGDIFPVFTYGTLIFTWISEIHDKYNFQFFHTLEKKLGLEVVMIIINLLLIGIGNNQKKTDGKYLYFGLFAISSIVLIIASWGEITILISMIVLLINHFIGFLSQTGYYGIEEGEITTNGIGPIFRFILVGLYGIPISFLIMYTNNYENRFVVGYSVVVYYIILLMLEVRYFMKQNIDSKKRKR